MKRRQFIAGIGAFFILPGKGRIWKAVNPVWAIDWGTPVCVGRCYDGGYLLWVEKILERNKALFPDRGKILAEISESLSEQ